ncbi:hypothetical protein [Hydrogenophaga sp.]|uniref:hypothetical protein n=1 Tax=Hydrogenophaga sp. TaxID=1904254 RepID=UPI0027174085|nr:hypothetical protein [Hydrogenophaga sp.]MDO9505879.1 hypothetical protein [Hydrogenophaga sp.]
MTAAISSSENLAQAGLTADELLDRLLLSMPTRLTEEEYSPLQTQGFLSALRAQARSAGLISKDPLI